MSYKIVTKYIKDTSFEISDAKTYFLLEKNIKNHKIVCDIKSTRIKEKTRMSAQALERKNKLNVCLALSIR